ncbi:F0F1 ATP synthase subunit delta [Marinobacterium lutimaris]|uniref:ATP synthase subunit b n=1 Tax=Marinobacterium lutimaris TaxID=568106 RepID=A0A1H5X6N3_9GAMM|nr:F0F1 ATP synthase subunit delta [Marinobacterium lutimaris]SEG07408.1 ATP synthase F0 subcomplex B subunit [Marinobacterium lutimaris]
MELSWSTLLLEIINFALLMWLLLHFFYKPLLAVIARRQARIEQQLQQAETLQAEAQALKSRYENRLSHWEQERQSAREALTTELAGQRCRLEAELKHSLEQQREKAQVIAQRHETELQARIERQAMLQAAQFATRLLTESAGPELQDRLIQLLLDSLPALEAEQLNELRTEVQDNGACIEINSAFPLSEDQQTALHQALETLLEKPAPLKLNLDPALIAGVRIGIGPWVLQTNVLDELRGFVELYHDGG